MARSRGSGIGTGNSRCRIVCDEERSSALVAGNACADSDSADKSAFRTHAADALSRHMASFACAPAAPVAAADNPHQSVPLDGQTVAPG